MKNLLNWFFIFKLWFFGKHNCVESVGHHDDSTSYHKVIWYRGKSYSIQIKEFKENL